MGKLKTKHLVVFLSILMFFPLFSHAQNQGNGPPFRAGEIVVSGGPGTLPTGTAVVKYLPNANLTVITVERGKEWGMVQKHRLKGKRAGLNYVAKASSVPNDQYYEFQWNLQRIQSETAWDMSTGSDIIVAVLDTGLAFRDVDGVGDGIGCVEAGKNIVSEFEDEPLDGNGHGTHVSGTIAQATGNGVGVAGLAYNACIMPVKVLDDMGDGSFADIADGIVWAVNNHARVINMSLGSNARYNITSDALIDPALEYAKEKGVTIVCAAGNDSWRKNVSYPAIHPATIAVGATDFNNARVSYSNYGLGLDIMAPGGNLNVDVDGNGYADGILQETNESGVWDYYFYQGTSMAAPHISAVAALILAFDGSASPTDIKERITDTALDIGDAGYDKKTAFGLIQAADALGETSCDGDGDGFCIADGDCNDNDAAIYPGAPEVCGNNIDESCDGTDEVCDETCFERKQSCSANDECCSGTCNQRKGTCR